MFLTFFFVFLAGISKVVLADSTRMRCSLNSDCRAGFVCVGGKGADEDTAVNTGCCEIILPIRQVCLMHNFLTGMFGKGITILVVISMGITGMFGKLSYKSLITCFVGIVCIFGSYQLTALLIGRKNVSMMCEIVDTSTPPGKCADAPDEENVANSVG